MRAFVAVVPGGSLAGALGVAHDRPPTAGGGSRVVDPVQKARDRAHMAERKEALSRQRRARRLVKYRVGLLVCPAVPETEQAWRGWR